MSSFYEKIGGEKFFADLVAQFYAHVAVDPILRPMYPDTDYKAQRNACNGFLNNIGAGQAHIKKIVDIRDFVCGMLSFI